MFIMEKVFSPCFLFFYPEFLVILATDRNGNLSKLISVPFLTVVAHLKTIRRGSYITRWVDLPGTKNNWWHQNSESEEVWFSHNTGKRKKNKREMLKMYYSLQGDVCIMGMKRIFHKLKVNAPCVKTRDQYISQLSVSCPCTEADFEWWVSCSAATLFTSLHPLHKSLSISRGGVYHANWRHNAKSVWRRYSHVGTVFCLLA